MGKNLGALGLVLTLAAGCCQHPGLFQKVQRSLETVQSYYTPLLNEEWQKDERRTGRGEDGKRGRNVE